MKLTVCLVQGLSGMGRFPPYLREGTVPVLVWLKWMDGPCLFCLVGGMKRDGMDVVCSTDSHIDRWAHMFSVAYSLLLSLFFFFLFVFTLPYHFPGRGRRIHCRKLTRKEARGEEGDPLRGKGLQPAAAPSHYWRGRAVNSPARGSRNGRWCYPMQLARKDDWSPCVDLTAEGWT